MNDFSKQIFRLDINLDYSKVQLIKKRLECTTKLCFFLLMAT